MLHVELAQLDILLFQTVDPGAVISNVVNAFLDVMAAQALQHALHAGLDWLMLMESVLAAQAHLSIAQAQKHALLVH